MQSLNAPPHQAQPSQRKIGPSEAAAELLARDDARDSLLAFTRYTMPGFVAGQHHARICEALERVERGECKRLMIFAPPRHTKSELASRRFPSWFMGRNPDKQLICTTYGQDLADDFGRDVREIIKSEEFGRVFDTTLAADSTARNKWRTDRGGIYVSAGVDGPITGRGAHVAMIDDPFKNRADAESAPQRKRVWDWYRAALRTRLMPGGSIIIVNTRWHEDDLCGRLLNDAKDGGEQWEVISLPAIDGGLPLWPEWFDIDELEAIRRALGPRDWLALYQQTPTAEEGLQFKREWMQYYTDVPTSLNVYMSGDFAVTPGGGDFTELAVWGVDHKGDVYALAWWSGQTGSDVWVRQMVTMFKRWKPLRFIGEGGPIRRAVEPYLTRAMSEASDEFAWTACEWLPASSTKEANARSFEAMCANGRVYWPRTEWAERVIDQLLRFPGGQHDDAVDTCSLFGRYIASTWASAKPKSDAPPNFDAPLRVADVFTKKPRAASW